MPISLFDRLLVRPKPWWVMLVISLVLLSLPFLAAFLDGFLPAFLKTGLWRVSLVAPGEIIYILLIAPPLSRIDANVLRSFRPVVQLDDEQFNHLVYATSRLSPTREMIVFAIGALLAPLLMGNFIDKGTWFWYYWLVSSALMYGLLAWIIYASLVNTRLMSVLHKQPLKFDLFGTAPFEAVGKQSLVLALAFIGGISLSLVLAVQPTNIQSIYFWLTYIPIALVTVLVFFLNMRPTHKLLSARKASELAAVDGHIQRLGRMLLQQMESDQDPGTMAAQINAMAVYEQRLQNARTWPYDTSMLSTLFFSVLVPGATMLAKLAFDLIF